MEEKTYSVTDLIALIGVSRNRLRYWIEMKYLTGYTKISDGVRSRYQFSEKHVELLTAVEEHLQRGHPLAVAFDRANREILNKNTLKSIR